MAGAVESAMMLTVKLHTARSRQTLVTVQTTVVVPGGKRLPDGGTQTTVAGSVQFPPVTTGGAKFTGTGFVEQFCTVRLGGHAMVSVVSGLSPTIVNDGSSLPVSRTQARTVSTGGSVSVNTRISSPVR